MSEDDQEKLREALLRYQALEKVGVPELARRIGEKTGATAPLLTLLRFLEDKPGQIAEVRMQQYWRFIFPGDDAPS